MEKFVVGCFTAEKSKISHFYDIFSNDLGHWIKSKAKSRKCEHLEDQVMSIDNRSDVYWHYHHKRSNFHKVILTVENEHEVNKNASHNNARHLKKAYRHIKKSVKDTVKQSDKTVQIKLLKIFFLEQGTFPNVQSPSEFPKHGKQISNFGYLDNQSNR